MGLISLITGPVRSGKSRYAVQSAQDWGHDVVFVATYRPEPTDAEMAERVRRHRRDRPDWRTLEAPRDVAASLRALAPAPGGVLLDCLTLWTSDRLEQSDEQVMGEWDRQLQAFREAAWPTLIVTNELGWGLVPPDPQARRFRDLAGTLAQRTATIADAVWLVVAGCRLRLK